MQILSKQQVADFMARIPQRQRARTRRGAVMGDIINPATLQNPQGVLNYMADVRAKQGRRARRYPFAGQGPGYSQNDPNCFPEGLRYDETIIFGDPNAIPLSSLPNSGSLQQLNQTIAASTPPAADTGAGLQTGGPYNFTVTPFFAGAGSQQVLSANPKRQTLLVQNQDAANTMFFNLGQFAGLNQGILVGPQLGILFDLKVPNNYVTVYSATGVRGVVVEGQ